MTTTTSKNAPAFAAYVVTGEGEHAHWHRIGSAWHHRDGEGINISLAAIPVSGRIVLRAPRSDDETKEGDAQ